MKKTIAIALLIFGAISCSLKEKITSYTEGDKYYRSVEQIKTGLNACYSPLKLIYTNMGFWEMCECATDLMYLNIDNQIDAVCDIAPARPGAASLVWQRGYQGVSRTNNMIFYTDRAVSEGYIDENEAAPLYAEAAVLRSFYWYILTSTFGDVPFYTERVTEENRTKIVKLPRMSAAEIRNFCIGELRKNLSAMPARV